MRRFLASLLLLSLVSAGCLQAPPEEAAAAQAAPMSAAAAVATAQPALPGANWSLATVQGTPEGGLGAFWWDVPASLWVPWSMNEEFGEDASVLTVELALVAERPEGILGWGLVTFEEEDGVLVPASGDLRIGMTTRTTMPGQAPVEALDEVSAEPTFLTLGMTWDEPEDQRLAVLLLAVTDEPMPVSFAWRVLDHDPEDDEEASETADAFVAARGGPAARIETTPGTGFAASVYSHALIGRFAPEPMMRFEAWAGDVEFSVTEAVAGLPYRLQADAKGAFDHGWALSSANHFGMSVGVVTYEYEAEARDAKLVGDGLMVEAWPAAAVGFPLASAGAFLVQEGDGGAGARLSVDSVMAPGLFVFDEAGVLEFGTTLEDLFGVPSIQVEERSPEGLQLGRWLRTPVHEAFEDALRAARKA